MKRNIQLMSCNVRGLGDSMKRREIFHYLNMKAQNVIFLQETHSIKSMEKRWHMEWGGTIIYSHGQANSRGVAILIEKKTGIKVLKAKIDNAGRYITLKVQTISGILLLVNVYAPKNPGKH